VQVTANNRSMLSFGLETILVRVMGVVVVLL